MTNATSTRARRGLSTLALLVAAALTLAGCASGSPKSAASSGAPTPSVPVPSGVTLTAPGSTLNFGETAYVPYSPNPRRKSVLAIKVTGVSAAPMKDFASYTLDPRTEASNAYYVKLEVTNLGTGDLGGTDVPLWALDGNNTLVHSSSFTNNFAKCPSKPLPAAFGARATVSTCQVYFLASHGTLTAVSFRPLQAVEPIVWKGTITPLPTATATPGKGSGKGSGKSSGKKSKKG